MRLNTRRAFTLIELLVVISIIALLSSVVLSSLGSARLKSRIAFQRSQLIEFEKQLQILYMDSNDFSTAVNNFIQLLMSCISQPQTNAQTLTQGLL